MKVVAVAGIHHEIVGNIHLVREEVLLRNNPEVVVDSPQEGHSIYNMKFVLVS